MVPKFEHGRDQAISIDEFVEVYEKLIRGPGAKVLSASDVCHMLKTKSYFSFPITSGDAYSLDEKVKWMVQQISSETRLLFEQRIEKCLGEVLKDFKISKTDAWKQNSEAATRLPRQLEVVQEMIKQLSGLDERQLEAGLGVILRDTLEYSLEHKIEGVTFNTITSLVIAEEEIEGVAKNHRLLFLDPAASIPTGVIATVLADDLDCSSLKDPGIHMNGLYNPPGDF